MVEGSSRGRQSATHTQVGSPSAVSNTSSQGSDTLCWPLWPPVHTHRVHIWTHTCKEKKNEKKVNQRQVLRQPTQSEAQVMNNPERLQGGGAHKVSHECKQKGEERIQVRGRLIASRNF